MAKIKADFKRKRLLSAEEAEDTRQFYRQWTAGIRATMDEIQKQPVATRRMSRAGENWPLNVRSVPG
jgi:hypothetical protein